MISQRPYSSNYAESVRKVVRWSPDAFVLFNGESFLPGCGGCTKRIDYQKFITQISCGAGTTPDSGQASISMSVPYNLGEHWVESSTSVLRNGLEVHIYSKGYFPVSDGNQIVDGDPNIPTHPYYQIFHGVVTSISNSIGGGFYSVSLSCNTMLHFWNSMRISTNGSVLGPRPENSGVTYNIKGNIFNGMSPFAIMYTLFSRDVGDPSTIAFALAQRTNVTASPATEGSDIATFDQARQLYWDRRFRQKPYNLRMYGISGRMFTTLQQAFLGYTGEQAETARKVTSAVLQSSYNNEYNLEQHDVLMAQATALGLLRRDSQGQPIGDLDIVLPELRFIGTESGGESTAGSQGLGYNLAGIDPFTQDLSSLGTVSIFSSEDMSKLEISSTVSESIGYEFYQDVDGDLVFKPPFFNLNTASSRVYRIEPIDIIDINFSIAEPEATYCIATNPYFQNLNGTALENEFGNRSVYIDWRLVMQYGWKSTDLQTSYFNNKNLLYYMASQHVDITNAKVMFTATITIPHRPEMRPGYPVYISHLDQYYYNTGVEHGIQYGGSCTTNLTLCARRVPFHAPGRRGEGISSIDLRDPNLPEKPLVTTRPDGTIKVIGFPNVVMTLDPEQINPLYFVAGADLTDLNSPESAKTIIRHALANNLLSVAAGGSLTDGPYEITGPDGTYTIQSLAEAQTGFEEALAQIGSPTQNSEQDLSETSRILLALLRQTQSAYLNTGSTQNPRSLSNLINLISDRKASFSPNVPGRYRYYSASHPDPDMQGLRRVDVNGQNNYSVGSLYLMQEGYEPLRQFLPNPTIPDNADPARYAKLADYATVSAGINIRRRAAQTSSPTPTHEITRLSFAIQGFTYEGARSITAEVPFSFSSNADVLRNGILRYIRPQATLPEFTEVLKTALQSVVDFFGPLHATGDAPATALKDYTYRDLTLEAYAELLGMNEGSAWLTALETQSYLLASEITSFYDAAFAPFNAGSGSQSEFQQLVEQYQRDTSAVADVTTGSVPSTLNFFQPVQQETSYVVPVFPISDAEGYTVIGSFPYGRGMRIDPGANFNRLANLDPLRFADPQAVDAYIEGVLGSRTGLPDLNTLQSNLVNTLSYTPAADTLLQYSDNPTDTSVDRSEALRQGLANFQTSNRDSIFKLPVNNSAYNLASIQPIQEETRPCACSATDSDIYLESFLENSDLFTSLEDPARRVSEWLREQVGKKVEEWKQHEEGISATPGSGLPTPPSYDPTFFPNVNIVDTLRESGNQFDNNLNDLQDGISRNAAQIRRIRRGQ